MIRAVQGLFSGFVASLSFEPIALWPFAVAALLFWYRLLIKRSLSQRLIASYFFGLGVLLPTQIWTGTYVGNLPWLILCFGQALIFLLPALLVSRGQRFNAFAFVASYVLVELLLRTVPFTGFGWTRLSFTQVDSPLVNLYPVFGTAAVALFLAWFAVTTNVKNFALPAIAVFLVSLIPNPVVFTDNVRVALVQGGVVNLGLGFNDKPKEVFNRHLNTSKSELSINQADLIVWPENAVDIDIFKNNEVKQQITQLSSDLSTPILIGGVTNSPKPRNQSMLFDPELKRVYTKRYLTPFGEYLPLRAIAERISSYSKQINDFTAGENPILFESDNFTFRALICYELLDDRFVQENTADFLILQTNNATFGDTAQLAQQLNIARVRAVESSRFIPYVSTTGITSFISPSGEIMSKIDKFKSAVLVDKIQKANGATYAQKYGWSVEPLAIMTFLFIFMLRFRGRG